jgi:hypothetical protein
LQSSRERLSIRAAVFLGVGLIFGLWLFAWAELSSRITDAQSHAAAINARYLPGEVERYRTTMWRSSPAIAAGGCPKRAICRLSA